MELCFSDDYFKGEERCGFYIDEKMKRAWAAQLVCLKDFSEVCEKNNLKWFAAYGTLIGAVRHKGFIPWDDDIDIHMPRADYMKFIRKAYRELPSNYSIINIDNTPGYSNFNTRITNLRKVDGSPEIMEKYYGFPYPCGIDLTPVDYVPGDPQKRELYVAYIDMTTGAANIIEQGETYREEERALINNIEKVTGEKISRGRSIPQQLREMAERFMMSFTEKDCDRMGMGIRQNWSSRIDPTEPYNNDKHVFDEIIKVPFETTEINIIKEYDIFLRTLYQNYTEYSIHHDHDYPFYKKFEEEYEEWKRTHSV